MTLLFITYLPARISPRTKFHFAFLIIEGKPGDVYFTGGLENARRDVEAVAITRHDHFSLVSTIEPFISAENVNNITICSQLEW